jgi:hypothetical protein
MEKGVWGGLLEKTLDATDNPPDEAKIRQIYYLLFESRKGTNGHGRDRLKYGE